MLEVGLSARSGIVRSGHLSPVRVDLPRTRGKVSATGGEVRRNGGSASCAGEKAAAGQRYRVQRSRLPDPAPVRRRDACRQPQGPDEHAHAPPGGCQPGSCARPVPGGVRLAGSGPGPELPASPRSRPVNGPFIRTREDEWAIHQDRPDEWASSSSGLTPGRLMNDTFIRPGPAAPARHLRPAPGRPAQDAASTEPTPRTPPAQRRPRRPGGPATATAPTPDPHSTRPPEPHNPGPPNRMNEHIHPRDPR